MLSRHAHLGSALLSKATEALLKLDGVTSKMDAHAMVKAIKVGVEIERLSRGEPTSHVQSTVHATIEQDKQIEDDISDPVLRDLMDKIAERRAQITTDMEGNTSGDG